MAGTIYLTEHEVRIALEAIDMLRSDYADAETNMFEETRSLEDKLFKIWGGSVHAFKKGE